MSTNYGSEFARLFGGGCSINGKDWNAPRFFDSQNNDCYAAEAALLSSLTSEAYSNFGVEVQYYIKDINIDHDRLYGEDPLENIVRRFPLKIYVEQVPELQKTYALQGMDYQEIITAHCEIQMFTVASMLDWTTHDKVYSSVVPKIGDIMYFEYSNMFYEIINVKKFAEGSTFLSNAITYTFILRVWKNTHEQVDQMNLNNDHMDEIRKYASLDETFDIDSSEKDKSHSTVGVDSDILEINKDLAKDLDKYNMPTDNVNSHVEYIYPEEKSEDKYFDPFDGW